MFYINHRKSWPSCMILSKNPDRGLKRGGINKTHMENSFLSILDILIKADTTVGKIELHVSRYTGLRVRD